MKARPGTFRVLFFLLLAGCRTSDPESIAVGRDSCSFCRMTIVDPRFGGAVVSPTGKVFPFDSIECLRHFAHNSPGQVGKIFLLDFSAPGTLIPVETAQLAKVDLRSTPMGTTLIAYTDSERAKAQLPSPPLETLSWQTLEEHK